MQLEVTKSNTLSAFSWIKNGWRLFTLQPAVFMSMSAIIIAFSLLANVHQFIGVLVLFMMPFLTAGFYQVASHAESGEPVTAFDIFQYFSRLGEYRVFARLAFLSILFSIPMTSLLLDVQQTVGDGGIVDFQTSVLLVLLLAINFMLFAFAVPAAWVAPETPVFTLIKQSFKACWMNVFPLTIYGLIILFISVLSMPIILIGWLIAYSLGVLSFYQMFLNLYRPVEEQNATVEVDEEPQHTAEQQFVDQDKSTETEAQAEPSEQAGSDKQSIEDDNQLAETSNEETKQDTDSEQVSEQVSETDRKDN